MINKSIFLYLWCFLLPSLVAKPASDAVIEEARQLILQDFNYTKEKNMAGILSLVTDDYVGIGTDTDQFTVGKAGLEKIYAGFFKNFTFLNLTFEKLLVFQNDHTVWVNSTYTVELEANDAKQKITVEHLRYSAVFVRQANQSLLIAQEHSSLGFSDEALDVIFGEEAL